MLSFFLLFACSDATIEHKPDAPAKEMTQADLDLATTNKDFNLFVDVMRGTDETLRTSAAERVLKYSGEENGNVAKAICAAIRNQDGSLNVEVAKALKGEERNEVADCFVKAVTDKDLPDREAALTFFADLEAESVKTTLDVISKQKDAKPKHRVQAARLIAGDPEYVDTAFALLKEADPVLRAGALEVLGMYTQISDARKPIKASLTDEEPIVRAAAMKSFYAHYGEKADETLCKAMGGKKNEKGDPESIVRIAAISAYSEVTRRDPMTCMAKVANSLETDPVVRQALLDTLSSAKGDARKTAYSVMCSALPFWLKNYVKGDVIDNLKGVGIVKALNNAHPTKSKKCINKAYARSSQFSCYAKMHIALWNNLKNGTEKRSPLCPGMDDDEGYTENID